MASFPLTLVRRRPTRPGKPGRVGHLPEGPLAKGPARPCQARVTLRVTDYSGKYCGEDAARVLGDACLPALTNKVQRGPQASLGPAGPRPRPRGLRYYLLWCTVTTPRRRGVVTLFQN